MRKRMWIAVAFFSRMKKFILIFFGVGIAKRMLVLYILQTQFCEVFGWLFFQFVISLCLQSFL